MPGREAAHRRRVLMTHDYPPYSGGGLALSVRELADTLAGSYNVTVLSARWRDEFADDRAWPGRVPTPDAARYAVVGVAAMLRELLSADLVIAHWTFSARRLATLSLVLGPLLGKPTICVIHTAPDHVAYNRLRRLPVRARRVLLGTLRVIMGRCTAVVAGSNLHATQLANAGLPVTRVARLPVSMAVVGGTTAAPGAHRPRPSRLRIGVAGELSLLKGADRLAALLPWLAGSFDVVIAGRGPLDRLLADVVVALSPDHRQRVTLTGRLDPSDMQSFYRDIDVLLLPSRTEVQPRVALEAMLSGVVVAVPLGTDGFGLVDDGVTGVHLDVECGPNCVAGLAALAQDREHRMILVRQALSLACRLFEESRSSWLEVVRDADAQGLITSRS
jgi:glycosyltransferase involved in cell wall biosynthesis